MKMRRNVKKTISVLILSCWLFLPNNAQAFVWPKLDMSVIGSIVNSVTTGVSKVNGVKSQIEGYIQTIQAVGDQISMVAKYVSDIKQAITLIKDSVTKLKAAITEAVNNMKEALDTVTSELEKITGEKQQIAENTTKEVEENVDTKSEEELLETVQQAKEETAARDKEIEELLTNSEKEISTTLEACEQAIDSLVTEIRETNELDNDTKQELIQEANQIRDDIDALKEQASQVLSDIREKYTTESKKVIDAYDEYSKAVSDYYAGKISKDELIAAGDKLKNTIASEDNSVDNIDKEKIDNLVNAANAIAEELQRWQEEVLDKMANNKEYSDEDDEPVINRNLSPGVNDVTPENGLQVTPQEPLLGPDKTSSLEKKTDEISGSIKYVFNYHSSKTHIYLKSTETKNIYAKTDKSFLLSGILNCDNISLDKLETEPAQVDKLRDCVTRAKTEKEYFAAKGLQGCGGSTKEAINKCDPFKDSLYKPYKNKGVYSRIQEDYDASNIINVAKMKQYAYAWQESDKGALADLSKKIQDGSAGNNKDNYGLLGLIEIEAPQLWSGIRKIDAMHRAKKAIGFFRAADFLYLDGRNDDFVKATSQAPGRIDQQDVFPNVMLYNCDMDAEDVSVDPEEKNGSAAADAENNIVDCMRTIVRAADAGLIGDGDDQPLDGIKQEWREKETGSSTDSMFKNFTIATRNLYKSGQDYAKKSDNNNNDTVVSLQEGAKSATNNQQAYASGAKINFYTTNQLLSIIESDAIALQTEIVQNLSEMSYNYFDINKADSGE